MMSSYEPFSLFSRIKKPLSRLVIKDNVELETSALRYFFSKLIYTKKQNKTKQNKTKTLQKQTPGMMKFVNPSLELMLLIMRGSVS